mgnify:CR=1 FL=1
MAFLFSSFAGFLTILAPTKFSVNNFSFVSFSRASFENIVNLPGIPPGASRLALSLSTKTDSIPGILEHDFCKFVFAAVIVAVCPRQ